MMNLELRADGQRRLRWLRYTFLLLLLCTLGVGAGAVWAEALLGGPALAVAPALVGLANLVLARRLLSRATRYGDAEADARLLFHQVVDHLPSGFSIKEPVRLTYTAWNRSAEQLTGIAREDALGRTAHDLFSSSRAEAMERSDREALAHVGVRREEGVLDQVTGARSIVSRRVSVRDVKGQVAYLFVIDDDVTPLRAREQEVLERHKLVVRHQQALLELGQAVPAGLDDALALLLTRAAETLEVARAGYWSMAWEETAIRCQHLVVSGVLQRGVDLTVHAGRNPAYFAALWKRRPVVAANAHTHPATAGFSDNYLTESGVGAMLDVPVWHVGTMVGILCFEHVGGSRPWAQEQVDFAVAVASLVSINLEADRRRIAEAALGEQQRADAVAGYLNAMPIGVFAVDAAGRPDFANAAAEHLLGRGVRPDVGLHELAEVYQVFLEGSDTPYPTERLPIVRALNGESCRVEDMEVRAPGRDPVPLEVFGNPVRGADGEILHAVAVFRDITERRQIERVKDELISVVSHELRTPMTAIIGGLGLVEGGVAGEIPPAAAELVRLAHSNAKRLVRLLDDMLHLEKNRADDFRMAPCSMLKLVSQAVALAQPSAGMQGVEFIVHSSVEATLHADGERLLQVLANLLSNAVKYSPRGGQVGLAVSVEGRQTVLTRIMDQGPGISPQDQRRLFQRFVQLDSSSTRAKGGTGLGLAICKQIVERHGGTIGVESKEGGGSTFWFELPIVTTLRPS